MIRAFLFLILITTSLLAAKETKETAMLAQKVLNFWFQEIEEAQWWKKDSAFDQEIKNRFGDLHTQSTQGELFSWRETPEGRLAEIIVLDQFSRNIYRNTPKAFASDPQALSLAQEAVHTEDDQSLPPKQRAFIYLPYMHSESKLIHEEAVKFYSQEGMEGSLDYELQHKVIIDRFGRYPHRNEILGRESTEEEIEFLKEPGSSF